MEPKVPDPGSKAAVSAIGVPPAVRRKFLWLLTAGGAVTMTLATVPLRDAETTLAGNFEYLGVRLPEVLRTVAANWTIGLIAAVVLVVGGYLLWRSRRRRLRAAAADQQFPERHRAILQELAAPLATVQDQSLTYGRRDADKMAAAKAEAEELISQISYDRETAQTVRDFLQACVIVTQNHSTADEMREARQDVARISPTLFRYLHEGRSVDRGKVDLPDWCRAGDEKKEVKSSQAVPRSPPSASPLAPSRPTLWDRLEEMSRGSFLRYMFAAKHRETMDRAMDRATEGLGTIGAPPPPPSPSPAPALTSEAPRQSSADLSHIGKAILDRYDGQVETFAFRKAVLQLSEVKATATQRGGEKQLCKIECHMDIENHTRQQFRKCRVRLVAINGERLDSDTFLRIGGLKGGDTATEFPVRPHHSKARINFMKRDLDDVVSNPPFLLCLNDRDLPLSDGKEYRFVFALECEYEHPTYATVRFYVPEREKVEIELLTQSLDMPDE